MVWESAWNDTHKGPRKKFSVVVDGDDDNNERIIICHAEKSRNGRQTRHPALTAGRVVEGYHYSYDKVSTNNNNNINNKPWKHDMQMDDRMDMICDTYMIWVEGILQGQLHDRQPKNRSLKPSD